MQKGLQFTVDSALLRELGEKLVETVHLALAELVKNAYDADATEVDIAFEPNNQGRYRIRIEDNGIGMNFDAVQNYWMRIATTNKDRKDISVVYGRHLTGAKGIGRFSCRRLGDKLTLITQGTKDGKKRGKQKELQKTIVEFPWTEFEAGSDVTEITCPGEQSVEKIGYTGTSLIIDGVSEEWTTSGLNWLKRKLAVLTANRGAKREGFEVDPGFMVMLTAPDLEGEIRDIRNDLINAGWGTLTANINNMKQAVCELNAKGIGIRKIISKKIFPHLNDIKLYVGIMVDDREQMRDLSVISKGTLQEILPEWGGIQIRHRGFRVFPYGDDDWLKIDRDRGLRKGAPDKELNAFAETLRGVDANRSLLNMLSMQNYIGNVEIGSKSVGFELKASREGFIESQEMDELKEFTRFAIDWTTILRDYYLRQQSLKIAEKAKNEFEDTIGRNVETGRLVESAINYIDSEFKNKIAPYLPTKEKEKIEKSLLTATHAIRKHNEASQVELSHLRLIASTSTLLIIFSHEVKSFLGLIEQSKNSLTRISRNLDDRDKRTVNEIINEFSELNDRLEELLQMTSLISSAKSKLKP